MPRPDLSIQPQRNSVMEHGSQVWTVLLLTFALFGSLLGLIRPAIGFPARVKGYCSLRSSRRADTRTSSHQEQRTVGGSQRAGLSPECSPSCQNLNVAASRAPRGYVAADC
jgi:hypothetical protein